MLTQISLFVFKEKKNNEELNTKQYDMEWKVRIYKQMVLTLAHEVKTVKLTNNKNIFTFSVTIS